jgi:hypothetical protein
MTNRFLTRVFLMTALAMAATPEVSACATCFGASDAPMAVGMNMGIMALLVVIGTVLAAVASFFAYLAIRATRVRRAGLGEGGGREFTPPTGLE